MEYHIKCEICGKEFTATLKGKEKHALTMHIKLSHKDTNVEDYVEKYYYHEQRPKCACGCGNFTKYSKFKFNKFFIDHKNNTHPSKEVIEKTKKTKLENNTLEKRINKLCYSKDDFICFYNDFIQQKKDFSDLHRETALDKRTIKKYWKEFELIEDLDKFERIIKINQIAAKKRCESLKIKIDENILFEIYDYLVSNPNKYTLTEIVNKFDLNVTKLVLNKRLEEKYGKKEIFKAIKHGNSSNPELEFYNVLKYFLGNEIQKQFRLENKVYDYILCEKILIEFDGIYWHSLPSAIENDRKKDEIAIRNGYQILRVNEKEAKNIKTLLIILELYEKIQINRN